MTFEDAEREMNQSGGRPAPGDGQPSSRGVPPQGGNLDPNDFAREATSDMRPRDRPAGSSGYREDDRRGNNRGGQGGGQSKRGQSGDRGGNRGGNRGGLGNRGGGDGQSPPPPKDFGPGPFQSPTTEWSPLTQFHAQWMDENLQPHEADEIRANPTEMKEAWPQVFRTPLTDQQAQAFQAFKEYFDKKHEFERQEQQEQFEEQLQKQAQALAEKEDQLRQARWGIDHLEETTVSKTDGPELFKWYLEERIRQYIIKAGQSPDTIHQEPELNAKLRAQAESVNFLVLYAWSIGVTEETLREDPLNAKDMALNRQQAIADAKEEGFNISIK